MLDAAAQRMSLVARRDRSRLLMRHFRECLAPELVHELPAGSSILDVGSGGGLPGIPIAIVRGDLQVGLVESRSRKSAFLERARLRLGLQNVRVIAAPLEEIPRTCPEERWDLALSRALRWTPRMVAALGEILTPAGTVIRFGSVEAGVSGVRVIPVVGDAKRAIQVWPPETWPSLSSAR